MNREHKPKSIDGNTTKQSKRAVKKAQNHFSKESVGNGLKRANTAINELSQTSQATSTDEAVGNLEGKVIKTGAKKAYKAYKRRQSLKTEVKQNNHSSTKGTTEKNVVPFSREEKDKQIQKRSNRLINRKPNSGTGRKKKRPERTKDKANDKISEKKSDKNTKYNKLEKTVIKGAEIKNKVTTVTDTLDGDGAENVDEGVAKSELKIVKGIAKKGYRSYKSKKIASEVAKNSKSSSVLSEKTRYTLNKSKSKIASNSVNKMNSKALQKKAIQKGYHYKATNKISALAKNSPGKIATKKAGQTIKTKAAMVLKKGLVAAKAVVTSKAVIIGGIAVLLISAIFVLLVVLLGLFGSAVSETAYLFTAEQATEIQQRYTEKELDYLEMIIEEAEPYVDDPNATIAYEPVGHDPHELLSLFNVLFHYEMSANDEEDFSLDDDLVDDIIDEIINARYRFEKTTEEEERTVVIPNHLGEDQVIQGTVTITQLTSRTLSINNIISGGSFNTAANTQEFIDFIAEDARELAGQNNLYASVMMAQAILETGSGSSGLGSPPHYNLFGIKGSYNGESVDMITEEDDGRGNRYTIRDPFRSYPSYRESMEDYVRVMLEQPSPGFYSPTYKINTNSFRDATDYLQGTYATDTQYASKLNTIIAENNLTQYDTPRESSESEEDDERILVERELGGNILELTEYEKELYRQTLEWRGFMGTYNFPVEQTNWGNHIIEPYGLAWNESENERYETDGLLVNVPNNHNVTSPVSGRVTSANSNSVTIRSEGTLIFQFTNLQNVNVSRGSTVRSGDVIGRTTNDGLLINTRTARRYRTDLPVNPQLVFYSEHNTPIMYSSHMSQMTVTPDSGDWLRPNGGPVTSEFGFRIHPIFGTRRMHNGIDIGGGGPILASRPGTVTTATFHDSFGYYVVIDHGDEYRSLYAHMLPNLQVSVGQQVEQGQTIGTMGTTGDSTGVHLHFEIHKNGQPQNPRDYIDF